MTYLDLTQAFTEDMPVYPGDPAARITQYAFLEKDGSNNSRVDTTMHVGTHIDAPLHFIEGAKKILDFSVEQFIGTGVLIDARGKDKIDVELLQGLSFKAGDIVLICTGHDKQFRTPAYYDEHLNMTEPFAEKLVASGIRMVGLDSPSPDRPPFPVHKILLSYNVLIAENLANLDSLIGVPQFEVIALPVKYDTEAAPARVVARY